MPKFCCGLLEKRGNPNGQPNTRVHYWVSMPDPELLQSNVLS